VRTIDWMDGAVVLLDQTKLPHEVRTVRLTDVDELVDAIRRLAVRGAPALGAAGALGVLLAVRQGRNEGWSDGEVAKAIDRVRCARPTAVNLAWAVDRVARRVDDGDQAVEQEARAVLEEVAAANLAIACRGADLLIELCGQGGRGEHAAGTGLRLHTHCNTGALACVEWGTALGVVRALHERGAVGHVYADETRPLLQGSRLTAWELSRAGVECTVIADGAIASRMRRGDVACALVGADRIAANGDVANKVGTYALALAAKAHGVPLYVLAPSSTIDPAMPDGAAIPIELRAAEEVTAWRGVPAAAGGVPAWNPAFDVTPADLVSAIVTDRGVVPPGQLSRLMD
jgi:methylthioribose-1-phosphate isomerase